MILTRGAGRSIVGAAILLSGIAGPSTAFGAAGVFQSGGAAVSAPSVTAPAASAPAAPELNLEKRDAVLAAALLRLALPHGAEELAVVADRYYQMGVRDKALEYYSQSLRRDRTSVRGLDGTARVWRDWGQLDQALGSAHRAVYFAPASPEAWNTLGTIFQALDQNALAAAAYSRALSLDAKAVYARSNLCYLALAEGQTERAIEECLAAGRMDGAFKPALNNLALAYAVNGDRQLSSETFVAANGEAVGHYNTGLVLLARREYAAAVLEFEAAYRVDPSFDKAHARAREARLLVQRGKEFADVPR